ncbi:DUF6185 family protein [Streptomyces sp. NPDC086549]|uniref:DUF6185 family protein n=1 Tax=Streptomyces sp. NPDC086549 TaxID=3365752 RepID=UPI003801DB93
MDLQVPAVPPEVRRLGREDPVAVIRRRCSVPHLLSVLLLTLVSMSGTAVISHAAEAYQADSCGVDKVRGVKVTASAEFDHRGQDYSMVTSVMEIKIPAGWGRSADLLLDTHASRYREVLRCLLGKVSEEDFYDEDEWRLKPLTVHSDEKGVVVHYEAVAWVQGLGTYQVGPWRLVAGRSTWSIRLVHSEGLAKAVWEDVQVHTGGPRPLSVATPPASGENGTLLSWHNKRPTDCMVTFRPPAAQQWGAIGLSQEQAWEALGVYSGSAAAWYVVAGALLLIAVRKIRQGLGRRPIEEEEKALRTLRSWALLQVGLSLLVYMGDNVYYFMADRFSWIHDYWPTVALFSLLFMGLILCLFGKLQKSLLALACALAFSIVGLSVGSEVTEDALFPASDVYISPAGTRDVLIAYAAAVFVFCMGAISAGQRSPLTEGQRLSKWQMTSISAGFSVLTILWEFPAFSLDWDRRTWLADPAWPTYRKGFNESYDWWWYRFPNAALPYLWESTWIVLTALVLLGALRACRAERNDTGSFTPTRPEMFLLVVLFALVALPDYSTYFGISGTTLGSLIGLCTAWMILSLARSKSVLRKPSSDGLPLGQVISQTDRSHLLSMVRQYRELQDQLHHADSGNSVGRAATQSVERQIDQLDRCLPEGVRPIDVAFALGPMATWWANACRCAIIACFVGLPATAVMYWNDMVGNNNWVLVTLVSPVFPSIVLDVLSWQLAWMGGAFFLGALWRDLPGRHGPTKAFCVSVAFSIPVAVHRILGELSGQSLQGTVAEVATFTSVLTVTGLVMDVQTFQSERRYWPTSASLVVYIYRMRLASVAFFLAQLVALVSVWKALREGGPTAPPPR